MLETLKVNWLAWNHNMYPDGTYLTHKIAWKPEFFQNVPISCYYALQYTEGQIKAAKETQGRLSECIFKLRDFPLPVTSTNLNDPE